MKSIFEYDNYRTFLKDYYQFKKSFKNGFTYASFAKSANLGSSNYYKLVMDGTKNLTSVVLIKFAAALELNEEEREYFENLVLFNQARTTVESEHFQMKLGRIRNQKVGALSRKTLQEFEFEYISSWSYHAVMLLTYLDGFIESPKWISHKLYGRVSPEEVSVILARLISMGLLSRGKDGKLKQVHKRLTTTPDMIRQSSSKFYDGLLSRGIESLKLSERESREFNTQLVGFSKSQLPELKKKVRSFMNDLREWALQNEEPEQIYSFVFTGFPLSHAEKDKKWW